MQQQGRANCSARSQAEESGLKSAINELAAKGQAIDIREVAELARSEAELDAVKGLDALLNDETTLDALQDARVIADWLAGDGQPLMRLMRATADKPRLADLAKILDLQRGLAGIPRVRGDDLAAVCFFTGFAPHFHDALENLVRQYHGLKKAAGRILVHPR